MMSIRSKNKQDRFDYELLDTVKKLQRKVIPEHYFWDAVAAYMGAPVSKCVLMYNKLMKREIVEQPEIVKEKTLKDRIESGNDFSLLNVVTYPERTIKLLVYDERGELVLYVKEYTLRYIDYFRYLMQESRTYEVVMNADRQIVQSIMLYIENSVSFSFAIDCFEKQFAAIDFLGVKRLRREALAFASQQFCTLGRDLDFRVILTAEDCETLLCYKTIVSYCTEAADAESPADNSLLDKLLAHIVEQFEKYYADRMLVCRACQQICTAEVADKFGEQLFCAAESGQGHKFEYRLNILGLMRQYYAKQCAKANVRASKLNYLIYWLGVTVIVISGCDVSPFSNFEYESVLFYSDVCKKYKLGAELRLLRGVRNVITAHMAEASRQAEHSAGTKPINAPKQTDESELVGQFAFETTGMSRKRHKLLNSAASLEQAQELQQTPVEVQPEAPLLEMEALSEDDTFSAAENEEENDEIDVGSHGSQVYHKGEVFVSNFRHYERKFNRYMELKPYMNERYQKSLLREACSAEIKYRMERLTTELQLYYVPSVNGPARALNLCFFQLDKKLVFQ